MPPKKSMRSYENKRDSLYANAMKDEKEYGW